MTQAMTQTYYSQQIVDLVSQREPLEHNMVELLEVNQRDSQKRNALFWAIKNQSKRNVSILIEAGISLMVKPRVHAMFHAIEVNNLETLTLLVNKGLSINIVNDEGQSLLMKALEKEALVIVQYLINHDIDLYMMDDNYDMAIDYAKRCKNKKVFELVHYKVLNEEAKEALVDCRACGCGMTEVSTCCGSLTLDKGE